MNLEDLKTPFEESEIEWRVGQCGKTKDGKTWAMVLAYISARAAQDRLDKVCGPENWRVEYEAVSAENLAPGIIGKISIKIGDTWITKEDGSDQSETEPFKGGLSGAFKRAASVWGIGRYLYDLPSGYAEIFDNKMPDSIYANAKQKDGSYLKFYWKPPKLPAWALPKKEIKEDPTKKDAEPKNQSPFKGPIEGTPPTKPPPKTIPPKKEDTTKEKAPDDEIFNIGTKVKGKKFSEVLADKGFLKWVNDTIIKEGEKAHGQLLKFHRFARYHGAYKL